ncbi:hypothetical protein SAMN05443249_0402 [Beijerinckia sp. 28-YEA-48]|nr:hypothetical protein SAMN05443249_0402 [Beijerinckia sp. 28-YEA-48]
MDMMDLTSGGLVYRWTLVAGYPRCIEDAIRPTDAALPALQRNAAIRTALPVVTAYEVAQAFVVRGEPDNGEPKLIQATGEDGELDFDEDGRAILIDNPTWALAARTVTRTDAEGQETEEPEPRWVVYDAAVALIAGAAPLTVAWATWRQPEPSEDDPDRLDWLAAGQLVEASIDVAAETPLADDPRPLPLSVTVRQFAQASAMLGHITQTEALNWATRRSLPAQMEDMLDSVPEQYRWDARMLVEGASTYEPSNDFMSMFAIVANISEDQQFAIWRTAAALA